MANTALLFELIAKDGASPAFLKVAGAADKAAASTERATKSMAGSVATAGKVGAKLTKAITLPLAAIGAVSVDQAAKFQKSLNTIQVATDRTNTQMAQGSKGLLTIAKSTGTGLSQLTDSFYTASKSGLSVANSLAVTKAAAQGAKAENADLGTVTDALTSVMASYGKTLKSPVTAMNEIIRGAGLAKTNLADFAGSLSNVVPLASSLHISFAQVAGAIDTMTQHGETAQRATDNLSNLITNLAGQNNVASASLQQLGVNTISLSKNLGKKGLTGSLDTVLSAINKHGKDGEIVTSSFKKAATATQSLQTELGAMTGTLKTNSEAFANGKLGYKDYLAYTKSLGGQQYVLAKNFAATVGAADGFNKQLTSGNSTTKTLAATLQKALGGVTGMRVALMLSGASAKTFAADTKAVAKAAGDGSGDVLGWAKTQETLAVKVDKAKASLQVMAVEIGSKLIPVVTNIVDHVSKAVAWFDNLSGTDKKIVAWSAVSLAALGPVLSISSRLAKAGTGFATFAGASETAATRVGLSMQRLTGALVGAGLLYGSTQTGGAAGKVLGIAGGAITGAAIGSFFGPIGTAVGGLTGAVAGLGISYLHSGSKSKTASAQQIAAAQAAKQAIADQKAAVDTLVASIQDDNDALGKNTRLQVENDLQKSGGFKLAQQLGLSTKTLTNASLGNVKAQQQIAKLALSVNQNPGLVGSSDSQSTALAKLTTLLGKEGINLHQAALTADQYAQANGTLKLATRSVSQEFALYGTTLDKSSALGKQNITFINSHIAALLSQRAAGKISADQMNSGIGTLKAQLAQYHFSTAQVDTFVSALKRVPKSVLTKIEKNGVTPAEIQRILDKYGMIPKSKLTKLNVTSNVDSAVKEINGKLATVHGKSIVVSVGQVARSANKAIGGILRGPGTGTSDSIPINASNGEFVVNAKATARNRGLLEAINKGMPGFASGGIVHKGKDWVYAGKRYASERAAENAKDSAKKADQSTLLSNVNTSIGKVGSAYSPTFSVADVGIARIRSQIGAATKSLNSAIRDGLSKKYIGTLSDRIKSLTKLANQQLGALRVKVNGSDLKAVSSALKGTVADTQSALSTLYTDLAREGAVKSLAVAKTYGTQLATQQASVLSAQSKLSTMKTYSSGISSTLSGAIDPTQFGTVNDLIGGFGLGTASNKAYSSEVSKLTKAGLNKTLLNQLAASGQTGILQSLAGAGASQIAQLNKAYSSYSGSVASGANAATVAEYGKSIAQQTTTVKTLTTTLQDTNTALGKLVVAIGKPSKAQKHATGGWAKGPGTGTSDSISARLSNGEFVVNAQASARNASLLQAINSGGSLPTLTADPRLDTSGTSKPGVAIQVDVHPQAAAVPREIGRAAADEVKWALMRAGVTS